MATTLATAAQTDDPLLDDDAVEATHIAPSTLARKAPPPQAQKTRGATGCLVMAPPPPRPPPRKKIVLEEDEYVDELRRIINRDYFPETASPDDVAALDLSLDAFAQSHTSEDNASFEEALEWARDAHVRKYWWCYDAARLRAAGVEVPDTSSLGTHLLSDGTRISEERRRGRGAGLGFLGNAFHNSFSRAGAWPTPRPPTCPWRPTTPDAPPSTSPRIKRGTRCSSHRRTRAPRRPSRARRSSARTRASGRPPSRGRAQTRRAATRTCRASRRSCPPATRAWCP